MDTATQRVASIQPHTLLYIMDGQVRSVPLQANGDVRIAQARLQESRALRTEDPLRWSAPGE